MGSLSRKRPVREVLADFDRQRDPDFHLGRRPKPPGWGEMTERDRLDWLASRMLAEDRQGVTSHTAMRESGILSIYQYHRRLSREVPVGDLSSFQNVQSGVFSRTASRDAARQPKDVGGMSRKPVRKRRRSS